MENIKLDIEDYEELQILKNKQEKGEVSVSVYYNKGITYEKKEDVDVKEN